MKRILYYTLSLLLSNLAVSQVKVKKENRPSILFDFEKNSNTKGYLLEGDNYQLTEGIQGQALSIQQDQNFNNVFINDLPIEGSKDFTVQFWVQIFSKKPTVLLSQKDFLDKSINSQKNKGWVLYTSGGTFAWNVGSGDRRLNYERENGDKMPLCDGEWHQLTMTYSKQQSEVRLYYDGHNKAIYKVGFDFTNDNPLVIGAKKNEFNYSNKILPQIEDGAIQLQTLVDEYNVLDIGNLKNDEFLNLISEPDELLSNKMKDLDSTKSKSLTLKYTNTSKETRKKLLKNPYTVFQIMELTELKPISKIYYLDNGKINIHKEAAKLFTQQTQLFPSEFTMDNLSIWEKAISAEEVLSTYTKFRKSNAFKFEKNIKSLIVGDWNIWHGGKHFTVEKDNWDSRLRIVEMIKEKNLDVILLQETYSSGDFIAAELGYYFATTSDWDYCFQGSNISVISRYPIKELHVPLDASFMNVGVKIALSETQEIYAMSNWYGMDSFSDVYDFHKDIFEQADSIPILFGGDFNTEPHTDGGESPASVKLLENGFIDSYRSLYPNVKNYPGYTHNEGVRIDQLYYKGQGLKNISTEVISKWPSGFPSDHFMILSKFNLKF